jgi:hypothetical protein
METALDRAIELLCLVHTRDDEEAGFTVEAPVSARCWFGLTDYVQAWETMRKHVDLIHARQTKGEVSHGNHT